MKQKKVPVRPHHTNLFNDIEFPGLNCLAMERLLKQALQCGRWWLSKLISKSGKFCVGQAGPCVHIKISVHSDDSTNWYSLQP